tara:strand:+ start:807 stop:2309 length:1503 start_codon:yes stop_codon:yes gene_type:complete
MQKLLTFLVCLIFGFSLFSQNKTNYNCNSKVKEVYNKIIKSIGNKSPMKPSLEIIDSKSRVAYISKGEIFIEQKAIDLFCMEDNFESKIAYILSHELAHHYLSHDWMRNSGLLYNSSIKDFVEETDNIQQRKFAETQADAYAGFYSLNAGYKSLNYASEVLTRLYSEYNISKIITGYPSFDQRIDIITSNIEKADNLTKLFEVGNLALVSDKLDIARSSYLDILKNDFNSREIYNNLGVTFLLKAIKSLDEPLSKYSYPIFIEQKTRADLSKTRSGEINNPIELLEQADEYFSLSIENDKEFENPKYNKLIVNLLKSQIQGSLSKKFLSELENTKTSDLKRISDIKVLYYLFSNKKNKAKKNIISGSDLSKFNYDFSYKENNISATKMNLPKFKDLDFEEKKLFGLNKTSKSYRTPRGKTRLKIESNYNYQLIEINKVDFIAEIKDKEYLIEISEFLKKDKTSPDKKMIISNSLFEVYSENSFVVKKTPNQKVLSVIFSF